MTKSDLLDAAKSLAGRLDVFRKSVDGAFNDGENIPVGDPRLGALHNSFSDPAGPLNHLLTMLGGTPVARLGAPPASPPSVVVEQAGVVAVTPQPAVVASEPVSEENMAVRLSFEDFLTSVGESMLKAQTELDSRSAQYLAATRTQPHVLPSVFRLPKLSASMKFAFDKQDTKKLNLVFFSSGTQESLQHQQEIQFDVVSAPAPLEAVAQLRARAPRIDFVVDAAERNRVLDAARSGNAAAPAPSRLPASFAVDRALLATVVAGQKHLLFFASEQDASHLGIWVVTAGPPPALEAIHPFGQQLSAAEGELRRLVLDLGAAQSELLKRLGG
jgi:hypothetical protein